MLSAQVICQTSQLSLFFHQEANPFPFMGIKKGKATTRIGVGSDSRFYVAVKMVPPGIIGVVYGFILRQFNYIQAMTYQNHSIYVNRASLAKRLNFSVETLQQAEISSQFKHQFLKASLFIATREVVLKYFHFYQLSLNKQVFKEKFVRLTLYDVFPVIRLAVDHLIENLSDISTQLMSIRYQNLSGQSIEFLVPFVNGHLNIIQQAKHLNDLTENFFNLTKNSLYPLSDIHQKPSTDQKTTKEAF